MHRKMKRSRPVSELAMRRRNHEAMTRQNCALSAAQGCPPLGYSGPSNNRTSRAGTVALRDDVEATGWCKAQREERERTRRRVYGEQIAFAQRHEHHVGSGICLTDAMREDQRLLLAGDRQDRPTMAAHANRFDRAVEERIARGENPRDAIAAVALSDPDGAAAHVSDYRHEDPGVYDDGDQVFLELEVEASRLMAADPTLAKVDAQRRARQSMSASQYARWRASMPTADGDAPGGDAEYRPLPLTAPRSHDRLPGAGRSLATGSVVTDALLRADPQRHAGAGAGSGRRLVGFGAHDML